MLYAGHRRAGRLRGLAAFWLIICAIGALVYTPVGWYMNSQFMLRGVKTGTGRSIEKREVKRIAGEDERTDYFLDIEYKDDRGETHRHARKCGEREWNEASVGPLAGIEFLRDRPDVYRLPGEYRWWYLAPPLSLGALALAGVLLLWIKLDPQDGHGGGSG